MQVSVETSDGLEKRMTVTVAADKIESEVKSRLKSMQPNIKLQGFRPGKVPMSVVEKRFGGQVRQEVTGNLVNESYIDAIKQQDLKPAGMPRIEPHPENNENELKFTATFEVYPELTIGEFGDLNIEQVKVDVGESDIENMIDKLRLQRADWNDVERSIAQGDKVFVDYNATIDGQGFAGGSGEDLEIVIGSGNMIDGFEDGLLGGNLNQVVEMDLTFPEQYQNKDVAGKQAHFTVTIKKIQEANLPELDDELFKTFGVEEGGLPAFKEELQQNMQRELENRLNSTNKNRVMDTLLNANKFDIPKSMVAMEADRLAQQMNDQLNMQQNMSRSPSEPVFKAEQFHEQGERRVALGLILSEIISSNNLEASAEKVKAEIESLASTYDNPKEVVAWYYQDKNRLTEVESMVLENQVMDLVLSNAQITELNKSFDEVMKESR